MNLTQGDLTFKDFEQKLGILQQELSNAEKINRDDILTEAINVRLHKLVLRYHEEVDMTSEYLLKKASAKVLKELTRINKLDDREVIEQYLIDLDEEDEG